MDAINEMFGSDYQPVSFVDERNTEVDMVQFVIQNPKIVVPEPEAVEAAPVRLTFWQKLLCLFGLYDPN